MCLLIFQSAEFTITLDFHITTIVLCIVFSLYKDYEA